MRYLRPSIAVFAVALLASLCVHLPIYQVLGELAEVLLDAPEADRPQLVELELAPLAEPKKEAEPEFSGKVVPEESEASEDEVPPEFPTLQKRPRPRPRPEPRIEPKPEPDPILVKPKEPQPQPEFEQPEKLAVIQKSDDPEVEAPENARFMAEENRRVEEERVARIRNMHSDEPEPEAGRPHKSEEEEQGNDQRQDVADLRNVEGSDERTPDEKEAKHQPKVAHEESAGSRDDRATTRAPATTTAASREQEPTQASGAQSGGQEETMMVQAGSGTFTIRKAPKGRGARNEGGHFNPGKPSPHRVTKRGAEAQAGIDLNLSWSQFESTFGAEELKAQRQAYLEQRRSRARGSNRSRQWRKFRAAIENFVPNVRPGNQTALNAAHSPFARYLNIVHRRIHRQFAHGFLRSLPIGGGPFADRTLMTKLEIVINGDGTLHKIGVAKTSGYLPFDYGAFNAVTKAAPFEPPPRKILSGDGRVYVHWGFYRNERQCGTFNARPFILPNPPGTPKPGNGPLRDAVPEGAAEDGELGWRHEAVREPHAHR
ncbi:MAG: hypothetical protein OXT09_18235 [Myxococcales bacterium]|nr:hypothetical protein [Myxococcales bacterium]